jgi:actin-related protein
VDVAQRWPCRVRSRNALLWQVVLTGGCVSLPGFVARFESELRALVPAELEVVIYALQVRAGRVWWAHCRWWHAQRINVRMAMRARANRDALVLWPQDPELTAWRGASGFAAGDNYWQCVKTRQQYYEAGAGSRRDR